MSCGCSNEKPTIHDIRHHRAVKAANEVCDRLDDFEAAQDALRRSRTPQTKARYARANADLQNARRRRKEAKEAALRVDGGG